jgi:alpha-L-fucosidase
MNRKEFIIRSFGLTAGALGGNFQSYSNEMIHPPSSGIKFPGNSAKPSRFSHRLPKSDINYIHTMPYVEDIPVPEYAWASDEAYEAFLDMKFGVRLHWGIYSIWQLQKESWPFLGHVPPYFDFAKRQEYNELYKTWNPRGFDAEQWMHHFKNWGMKMFAFTSKHHEGFSMFDTQTRVKNRVNWIAQGGPKMEDCNLAYSIMETPFKRDIIKELTDAAHKHGIKIDLYFSHPDWYDADFRPYGYHPLQIPSSAQYLKAVWKPGDPGDEEYKRTMERLGKNRVEVPDPTEEEVNRMVSRHRTQLKELLTNYGKIDMVCLDIYWGPKVWPQMRQTILELRKIQPDVMFRARGIGNYGDYYTPEGFVPGSKENSDTPWFVIYPLGKTFSYEPNPANYKGASWVVKNLIDSAAKGGNFMVGIGPDGNGEFEPTAIQQLNEVGNWLATNGEAIYATRSRNDELWKEGDNIRFTRSKDHKIVYTFCFEWPGDKLVLQSVKAREGTRIYLLGVKKPLTWKQTANGLEISLGKDIRGKIPVENNLAYTFKIQV